MSNMENQESEEDDIKIFENKPTHSSINLAPSIQNQYICLSSWFSNYVEFDVNALVSVNEFYLSYSEFCSSVRLSPFNIERWSSFILVLSASSFGVGVQRTRKRKVLHFTCLKMRILPQGGSDYE